MSNAKLAKMAQETMEITKCGFYEVGEKKIQIGFQEPEASVEDVIVLNREILSGLMKEEFSSMDDPIPDEKRQCEFYLLDCDSFEVAAEFERPLVMNFANALHPGGGFLTGATAQEECLCRNSTLYASISSEKAAVMYRYNSEHMDPLDSDYMLLSQNVMVFRKPDGTLLEEPYPVAVVTMPAPNRRGRAKNVPQEQLDQVMKERLRLFFHIASTFGYRELVLGAWGCGAFGHDTKTVAKYFYEVLVEEHFDQLFDVIAFGIIGDEKKCDAFKSVFGDKLDDCRDDSNDAESGKLFDFMKQLFRE